MEQRSIDRLGRSVSVVGLGTWQLGADWGEVADHTARSVLHVAVGHGVRHPEVCVATKMGRRVEQLPGNYNRQNLRA